jgi:hypothetical protein
VRDVNNVTSTMQELEKQRKDYNDNINEQKNLANTLDGKNTLNKNQND